MITKEKIRAGIENGTIKFATDPNMESGTVCKIGDFWFYFGGSLAEELSPEEYIKNVPLEDIITEISDVLEDFKTTIDFKDEYDYYDAILNYSLEGVC